MKSHEFDVLSFIAGLLIAAIGVLFLIPGDSGSLIDAVTDLRGWFWPVVFLAIGLAILVPALSSGLRRNDDDHTT